MKKRIFGGLLVAALVVTQAISVFAAPSKTAGLALAGDSVGKYTVSTDFSDAGAAVANAIEEVNAGASLSVIAKQAPELESVLSSSTLLSSFVDISVAGATKNANGKYEVTLSVPTLTSSTTGVAALHYSTERSTWEIVDPSDVDVANKEVTFEFVDLSPVAVIARATSATTGTSTSTTATSPKTGVESTWAVWMGSAAVLCGAAVVVFRRNRA